MEKLIIKNYSTYIKESKSGTILNIENFKIDFNDIENFVDCLIGVYSPKNNFKIIKLSEVKKHIDEIFLLGSSVGNISNRQLRFNRLLTSLYDMGKYLENLNEFVGNIIDFHGSKNTSTRADYKFEKIQTNKKINLRTGNAWDYILIFDVDGNSYDINMSKDIILNSKIKKIEKPDIDPYGEEEWGYEIIEN